MIEKGEVYPFRKGLNTYFKICRYGLREKGNTSPEIFIQESTRYLSMTLKNGNFRKYLNKMQQYIR
jgi:hypothetical protein